MKAAPSEEAQSSQPMKLSLAGVAMVKNEADIIELFIKINSRVFQKIYLLDHNSEDDTVKVIECMQAKGYPVELTRLKGESVAYNQAEITTRFVNHVARENDYEFIMPIDGDEFLWLGECQDAKSVLEKIRPSGFGLIPWKTYCPKKSGYLSSNAPLFYNFAPRNKEPRQYYKVFLGREVAKTCVLEMGNHNISNRLGLKPVKLPFTLQHVPVRTPEQISAKAYVGSRALAMKRDRKPGEGAHWDKIYKILEGRGMRLTHDDAVRIALDYACDKDPWILPRFSFLSNYIRIGTSDDAIEFKEAAKVDLDKVISLFEAKITTQ
jgi:hypothetical protein